MKSRTSSVIVSVVVLVDVFTNTTAAFLAMRHRLETLAERATPPAATVTIICEYLSLRDQPQDAFWNSERLAVGGSDITSQVSAWSAGTITRALGEECTVTTTCASHVPARWSRFSLPGGTAAPIPVAATRTVTILLSGDSSNSTVIYSAGPAEMPLDAVLPARVTIAVDVVEGDLRRFSSREMVLVGPVDRPPAAGEWRFRMQPNAALSEAQLITIEPPGERGPQ